MKLKVLDKKCEFCGVLCWAKGKRFFCSMPCRLKAYCTIDPITKCWNYREKWLDKYGYGKFTVGKTCKSAHRISYELFKGPIEDNKYVLHECDNRACVNPDHLWLGTNNENMMDMVEKERQSSKLNITDVVSIRKMWQQGYPQKKIAELFKIAQCTISLIVNGKKWKHIYIKENF